MTVFGCNVTLPVRFQRREMRSGPPEDSR